MTSWRDRIQALKPDETCASEQGASRGSSGSASRSQEGSWSAFSREPKNRGIAIAQAVKANEDSTVARIAIAEKRKYEEAVNVTSETVYPTLGSSAPAPRKALNFISVVKAALEKEEEKQDNEDEKEEEVKVQPRAKMVYTTKTFLDSFDDEDEGEDDGEGESEFNADLINTKRRGDKGIW